MKFPLSWLAGLKLRLALLMFVSVFPFVLLIGFIAQSDLRSYVPVAEELTTQESHLMRETFDGWLQRTEAVMATVASEMHKEGRARASNDSLISAAAPELPLGGTKFYAIGSDGGIIGATGAVPRQVLEIAKAVRMQTNKSVARIRMIVGEPPGFGQRSDLWAGLEPYNGIVIVGQIPVSVLDSLAASGNVRRATVTLVTAEGLVLARHADRHGWIGRNISGTDLGRKAFAVPSAAFKSSGLDGREKIFGSTRLKMANWIVIVGTPMELVDAQARSGLLRAIGWGMLALALAMLMALWQAQSLITPLRHLAERAKAYGRADFSGRTNISSDGELGDLARTMDLMAGALQERDRDLRSSEERYRLLFDSNPVPLYVFDSETFRILSANKAAREKYGYTEQEFLELSANAIRPDEDVSDFRAYVTNIGDRTVSSLRRRHRTKDGRIIEVELDSSAMEFHGQRARLVAAYDITSQVSAEKSLRLAEGQLQRAQKMEAIGQLTGGIAHDFNNLLTVIRSYAELMQPSFAPGDERIADLQEIITAQERGALLTRKLLAFGRQQMLQQQKVDLSLFVQEARGLLMPLVSEHIQLEIQPAKQPVIIMADHTQLTQVLINLVSNASDAMSSGGSLKISIDVCGFETGVTDSNSYPIPPGEYGALTIIDSGVGIPREIQGNIFDPFFTTKPVGKGTGMGLSTVYGIVKQLDGFIILESEEGEGSKFRLLFPCLKGEVGPRSSVPASRGFTGTESILLVEDELPVRSAVQRMLSEAGYEVVSARDGVEALQLAAAFPAFKLVLTDLVMPNMGGMELSEKLAKQYPNTRVVFMTGYSRDARVRQRPELDFALIEKPFTREDLLKKVRQVLDGSPVPKA